MILLYVLVYSSTNYFKRYVSSTHYLSMWEDFWGIIYYQIVFCIPVIQVYMYVVCISFDWYWRIFLPIPTRSESPIPIMSYISSLKGFGNYFHKMLLKKFIFILLVPYPLQAVGIMSLWFAPMISWVTSVQRDNTQALLWISRSLSICSCHQCPSHSTDSQCLWVC